MENTMDSNIIKQCSICQSSIAFDAIFCANCGYPENGTEKEKAIFHANKIMKKNKNMDAGKKVRQARNTLYILSGFILISGFFVYFLNKDLSLLIVNIILSSLYLVLGFWSVKKPLVALLLALLLYLTTIIISAIFDPTTIVRGIIWKALIIAFLGKGIYSASSLTKKE